MPNLVSPRTLPPLTAATITDVQRLRAECDQIIRDGHAWDREEFVPGLISIAVPVRDGSGLVAARAPPPAL